MRRAISRPETSSTWQTAMPTASSFAPSSRPRILIDMASALATTSPDGTESRSRSTPNAIEQRFRELKSKGRRALVPYITAGHPDAARTVELLRGLEQAGADVIELGLPFSDPMADGPVIQASSQ